MTITDSPERKVRLEKLKEKYSSEELLACVLASLEDKQGKDTVCVRIDEISTIADYVVLTSATSSTHLKVMADFIKFQARKKDFENLNPGLTPDDNWMLLDLGGVIVHIMSRDWRERYRLEELWKEGEGIDIPAFIKENPCVLSS